MQTPILIARDGGGIDGECPVCHERIDLPLIPRTAEDVAESEDEARRIRLGLVMHEDPRDAAGLKRVDKAARHVHTDVDLAALERHVAGHKG